MIACVIVGVVVVGIASEDGAVSTLTRVISGSQVDRCRPGRDKWAGGAGGGEGGVLHLTRMTGE